MKRKLSQMGYVTADLESALDYWIGVVGAGPFFYADYEPERQFHRGQPTHITFRNAYGYLGTSQIEIIQQMSGGNSAYTEALAGGVTMPVGGLFHHIMLLHDGYDAIHDSFVSSGAERCYEAFVPGVGRFCYLDARAQLGSYLELVEDTEVFEAASARMLEAHLGWDGSRPRRSLDEALG